MKIINFLDYLDKNIFISKPIKTRKWIKAELELDYLENTLKLLQNYIVRAMPSFPEKLILKCLLQKI